MQEHQASENGIYNINRDGAGFLSQDVLVNPSPEFFERGAEEAEQDCAAKQGKHDREMNQVLWNGTGSIWAQIAEAQLEANGQQGSEQHNGQQDACRILLSYVHHWIPPVNGLGSGDNNSTNTL